MGALKVIGVISAILIIIVIAAGGYLFYQAQGIQDLRVEDFQISEPKNITENSFTIDGKIIVNNPSGLTIPIGKLTYRAILKDTNEVIGRGSLPKFKLTKRATTEIPFSQTFTFERQKAIQLAQQPSVPVTMIMEITADLIVTERVIPFEIEIDIKPHIGQYLQTLQQQSQGQIPEGINIEDFQGNIPQLP